MSIENVKVTRTENSTECSFALQLEHDYTTYVGSVTFIGFANVTEAFVKDYLTFAKATLSIGDVVSIEVPGTGILRQITAELKPLPRTEMQLYRIDSDKRENALRNRIALLESRISTPQLFALQFTNGIFSSDYSGTEKKLLDSFDNVFTEQVSIKYKHSRDWISMMNLANMHAVSQVIFSVIQR